MAQGDRIKIQCRTDNELSAREQTLRMELEVLRDPQHVALEAQRMGMVIPAAPAFLRLTDGKVLGTPVPATREDGVRLLPRPPAKPAVLDPAPNIVKVRAKNGAASDGNGGEGGKNKHQSDGDR